jgi:trimeric autotransporter adhesin
MKTKVKNSISGLLFIPLLLTCFALLPRAQAETPEEGVTPSAFVGTNTFDGFLALDNNTTGIKNSAFGAWALQNNTTGVQNTAIGSQALRFNTTASFNTAVGDNALLFNTTGTQNMALGQGALANNLTGSQNTAMGFQALNANNATGNLAVGFQALKANNTGTDNVGVGFQALASNTTAAQNVAVGNSALAHNSTGVQNTALGFGALFSNTTAGANSTGANTAVGFAALASTTTGGANTGIGYGALFNCTGGGNSALGDLAGVDLTTSDGNICIGASVRGHAGEDNFIRIANNNLQVGGTNSKVFVGGIFGATIGAGGTFVGVNANGQLGTAASSARFKQDIAPMGKTSEAIFSLKPVTFHYKGDTTNLPCFGLIAEEVAKVSPDLILEDKEGKPLTVRYEQINAMLLNEFLKEHHQVQDLKTIVAAQQKQIEALTAGLQKVSAQIEMSRPAPQIAVSDQ